MQKSFGIESVDVLGEAGSGVFEAVVSVFGNVDQVKDVVMRGAFKRAITESDPPPIVWSHRWDIPPIGNTLDWGEGDKGLRVKGELFVGADDKHQYADMVYAGMKSRNGRKSALREFSFAYDVPDGGQKVAEREGHGRVQELHELFPIMEVGPTLKGCNDRTELLTPPKSITSGDVSKIEALARANNMSVQDFIEAVEQHFGVTDEPGKSVRNGFYPPEVARLMLAFPDH